MNFKGLNEKLNKYINEGLDKTQTHEFKIKKKNELDYKILDVYNRKEQIIKYLTKTFEPVWHYTPEEMGIYIIGAGDDLDILTGESNSYELYNLDNQENVEKFERELAAFIKQYIMNESVYKESIEDNKESQKGLILFDGKEEKFLKDLMKKFGPETSLKKVLDQIKNKTSVFQQK